MANKKEKEKKKKKGKKSKAVDLSGLVCPCCSKHCALSKPKCGKGQAVARKKTQKG